MAPRARHAKSKARVDVYEQLLAEEANVKLDRVEIHIPAGPRLGDLVVEARDVVKGYGDRLLIDDCRSRCRPAGSSASSAPNGAGKTTLFRMIAARRSPTPASSRSGRR